MRFKMRRSAQPGAFEACSDATITEIICSGNSANAHSGSFIEAMRVAEELDKRRIRLSRALEHGRERVGFVLGTSARVNIDDFPNGVVIFLGVAILEATDANYPITPHLERRRCSMHD